MNGQSGLEQVALFESRRGYHDSSNEVGIDTGLTSYDSVVVDKNEGSLPNYLLAFTFVGSSVMEIISGGALPPYKVINGRNYLLNPATLHYYTKGELSCWPNPSNSTQFVPGPGKTYHGAAVGGHSDSCVRAHEGGIGEGPNQAYVSGTYIPADWIWQRSK